QALGIAFTVASLALGVGLASNGLYSGAYLGFSAFAVAPALLGMVAGQRLRRNLSERRFRQALFSALLIMGVFLALRAFVL
ncbi:MAG: TSUP family transporter, partial [Rhodospirillaceae bacterium]|nr:TSUP family transporter [Rhodospirillaceae bacterium]MBT7570913.1 TSUP family transporter [Rhodospirillaceae bacterium]